MKKIFSFLLFLAACYTTEAQYTVDRASQANTVQDARLAAKFNFIIPRYRDTTAANLNLGADSAGAIIFTRSDSNIWVRTGTPRHWTIVQNQSSIFKTKLANPLYITTTDTILHVETASLTKAGVILAGYGTASGDTLKTKADARTDNAALSASISGKVSLVGDETVAGVKSLIDNAYLATGAGKQVGIGTNAPQTLLSLGNNGKLSWLYGSNASSRPWGFYNDWQEYGDFVIASTSAKNYTFDLPRLYVNSIGNMGIGTFSTQLGDGTYRAPLTISSPFSSSFLTMRKPDVTNFLQGVYFQDKALTSGWMFGVNGAGKAVIGYGNAGNETGSVAAGSNAGFLQITNTGDVNVRKLQVLNDASFSSAMSVATPYAGTNNAPYYMDYEFRGYSNVIKSRLRSIERSGSFNSSKIILDVADNSGNLTTQLSAAADSGVRSKDKLTNFAKVATLNDVITDINVTAYGVLPTNTAAQNTTAIASMIAVVAGGTSLYFPEGIYLYNGMTISKPLNIHGHSKWSTILKNVQTGGDAVTFSSNVERGRFYDIGIWGDGTNQYGSDATTGKGFVFANNSVLWHFDNVWMRGHGSYYFYADSTGNVNNINITNCELEYGKKSAIHMIQRTFYGNQVNAIHISGCNISGFTENGIEIWGNSITIEKNTIQSCRNVGISSLGSQGYSPSSCQGLRIDKNYFELCTKGFIVLQATVLPGQKYRYLTGISLTNNYGSYGKPVIDSLYNATANALVDISAPNWYAFDNMQVSDIIYTGNAFAGGDTTSDPQTIRTLFNAHNVLTRESIIQRSHANIITPDNVYLNTGQATILDEQIMFGNASPQGAVSAPVGMVYINKAGAPNQMLSIKAYASSAIDSTGWISYQPVITTGAGLNTSTTTLVAGTKTVSTTAALTGSRIFVTVITPGGTQGFLSVPTIVNGTSFTINSTSPTETSTLSWWILK